MQLYMTDLSHVEPGYPHTVGALGLAIGQPHLPKLVHEFLTAHHRDSGAGYASDQEMFPSFSSLSDLSRMRVHVHHSVACTFFAPSDPCGAGGMHREFIRATRSWWSGPPRYDCALVNTDSKDGVAGFDIARIRLLFSFKHEGTIYPCALVHWFSRVSNEPDEATGMWIVEPDHFEDGQPFMDVIHIDSIYRAAHLIGVGGDEFIPEDLTFAESLDYFAAFYVSKFADHHMFESLHV